MDLIFFSWLLVVFFLLLFFSSRSGVLHCLVCRFFVLCRFWDFGPPFYCLCASGGFESTLLQEVGWFDTQSSGALVTRLAGDSKLFQVSLWVVFGFGSRFSSRGLYTLASPLVAFWNASLPDAYEQEESNVSRPFGNPIAFFCCAS